jgi:hypothetical protein
MNEWHRRERYVWPMLRLVRQLQRTCWNSGETTSGIKGVHILAVNPTPESSLAVLSYCVLDGISHPSDDDSRYVEWLQVNETDRSLES